MGDWIDSLKLQHEQEATREARLQEIRLHDARIIEGKARAFFALVLGQLKADCEKMRLAFPHDNRYHPFITDERPDGFSLNGGKMPRMILGLDLNLNAQRIDLCQMKKESIEDQSFPLSSPPINITVGQDEELRFHYLGKVHDTPEALAQHLISYVCGIFR